MNRTDRLFAITTRLLGRQIVRAETLAQLFEVSKRTIYRDIIALSEAGVPVVSLPGQGYAIAEGYVLPPLNLTHDEALALLLGARMLRAESAGPLHAASTSGADKLLAILDDEARQPLQEIDRIVDIGSELPGAHPLDLSDARFAAFSKAIAERRTMAIRYVSREQGETTRRIIEPSRVSYVDGIWYLTAYCRLRQGERVFRFDRMDEWRLLDERFPPRALDRDIIAEGRTRIAVRFREPERRWVRERQHWTFQHEILTDDGVIFSYAAPRFEDIIPWLLGWGAAVDIVSPPELRARMRSEALAIAEMLT
mgnify:CR=1 FL=1